MNKVRPIPEGARTLSPHLVVNDAAKAMEFYAAAFGAKEVMRVPTPDGKYLMHAEMRIGDSCLMLCDEIPGMTGPSPRTLGGSPGSIHLWLEDVDATWERALKAGATVKMPLDDQFWGDRYGQLVDPFGQDWGLSTHIKDVTPEEMAAALATFPGAPPA